MKIIEVNGNKYVDEKLRDYINNIWVNFDIEIDNDSNIYFSKNTTVNRLITDYCGKNISRVIKREKADYVIINKFDISNYPQYYDGVNITDDDTKEIVYGIYGSSSEIQDTIELILDFVNRNQEVKYVNQSKLNDSLNNGFVIDKESYISVKELVDSNSSDNHELAVNMIINSNLKENWQWILYLFHEKGALLTYDKRNIIKDYFNTLGLGNNVHNLCQSIDRSLSVITNPDVKERFVNMVKQRFNERVQEYFKMVGTDKFVLDDFKVHYDSSK